MGRHKGAIEGNGKQPMLVRIGELLKLMLSSLMKREQQILAMPGKQRRLLAWSRTYLPRHFTLPPSAMHRWLAQQLDAPPGGEGAGPPGGEGAPPPGRVNCIGPRGSAKSTLVTLAYVLRAAVTGAEPYIWIVSDSADQARAHLAAVRAELEENRWLIRDYAAPPAVARLARIQREQGNLQKFRCAGLLARGTTRSLALDNGVVIEAFGTGQRIRGRRRRRHRPSLIVCDDVQNDSHIASAEQREASRRWFYGTLLPAGSPQTRVIHLATALHPEALALELAAAPGWTSRNFASIQRWPEREDLWKQWEEIYRSSRPLAAARAFYEANRAAMDEGAVVLWPQREDLYALMCMRVEGGRAAFAREKQGEPFDPALCEWTPEDFGEHIWFDTWPSRTVVRTIALDPSKGSDARAGDYAALVLLAIDEAGLVYLDADLARRPTSQTIERTVELCARFRPHALGVESNQFQELLADELERALRQRGLHGVSTWKIDNRVNKGVRIRRLGPHLARRRLRFLRGSPGAALLVEQLRVFPTGDHDDGPDAAEMALRLALELVAGRGGADGLPERLSEE